MRVKNKLIVIVALITVCACSARIGVPIPSEKGQHPHGTIIIIETDKKPKIEPRSDR